MADIVAKRLSIDECRAKADECRVWAKQTVIEPHRIMLEHIAETWERIAAGLI